MQSSCDLKKTIVIQVQHFMQTIKCLHKIQHVWETRLGINILDNNFVKLDDKVTSFRFIVLCNKCTLHFTLYTSNEALSGFLLMLKIIAENNSFFWKQLYFIWNHFWTECEAHTLKEKISVVVLSKF